MQLRNKTGLNLIDINPAGNIDITTTNSENITLTPDGGAVVPDSDSTKDLGTTSLRWANLYVDDITVTNGLPNPFDQSLNTTDSPTFVTVNASTAGLTNSTDKNLVTDAELSAITHSNRANLDSIDQDLATTDDVTFNSGDFTTSLEIGDLEIIAS